MKDHLARRPVVFITAFFAAGILVADVLCIPFYFLEIGIISALLFTILVRKSKMNLIGFACLFFFIGAFNLTIWKNSTVKHKIKSFLPLQNVTVTGRVIDPPKSGSRQFIAEIEELFLENCPIKINHKFLIRLLNPVTGLLPGDFIYLEKIHMTDLSPPRNLGQFNYSVYLKNHGIIGEISATKHSNFRGQTRNDYFDIKRWTFRLRENFSIKIKKILPENEANFLIAILLGKKADIQPDITMDFQNTGVAHILAVSGLHVGFVVLIIHLLISFLPISFRWHHLSIILILSVYVLLTGSKAPVVRASLMVDIYLIGKILERKQDRYNTVFLAAFIILLFQPRQLFWVNFQFSFVAVLSILFFYEKLRYIEELFVYKIKKNKYSHLLNRSLITPFLISFSAQLGTIPFMAIYFNKIPMVSFFLNIVVIPFVGLIIALGLMVSIFIFLTFPFTTYIANLLLHLIKLLIDIVHFSANFSFSYFQVPQMSPLVLLIYILVILMVPIIKTENYKFIKNPIFSLMIVLFLYIFIPKTHNLELLMMDVGQGESSLIRTPDNHILLFDTGPADTRVNSGQDVILPALLSWGKIKIDRLFISHPHADHVGGLFYLLNEIKIDSAYLPNIRANYSLHDSIKRKLQEKNVPIRYLKRGDHLKIGKYTKVYMLSPSEELLRPVASNISEQQINNTSLVTLIQVNNQTMLFTGDAEKEVEKDLSHWHLFLKSSILKIGHHGSNTSTSIDFLSMVRPEIGLISVGRNNKHNHPSKIVLKKLKDYSVRCFRTDQKGAIWLRYAHQAWEYIDWQ